MSDIRLKDVPPTHMNTRTTRLVCGCLTGFGFIVGCYLFGVLLQYLLGR